MALIYPEPEVAHRGKKSEQRKLLESKTFSGAYLSQARAIVSEALGGPRPGADLSGSIQGRT
jgi:hypothetical protein